MSLELYDLLSGKGVYEEDDEESGLQSDEEDAPSESSHRKNKRKTQSAKSKAVISGDETSFMNDLGLSSGQDFGLVSDRSMISLFTDGKIVYLSSEDLWPQCLRFEKVMEQTFQWHLQLRLQVRSCNLIP
jgi:hypothetical protein